MRDVLSWVGALGCRVPHAFGFGLRPTSQLPSVREYSLTAGGGGLRVAFSRWARSPLVREYLLTAFAGRGLGPPARRWGSVFRMLWSMRRGAVLGARASKPAVEATVRVSNRVLRMMGAYLLVVREERRLVVHIVLIASLTAEWPVGRRRMCGCHLCAS